MRTLIKKIKKVPKKLKKALSGKNRFKKLCYYCFEVPRIKYLKATTKRVKLNTMVFETKPDFADNGRALFDYMVANNYNEKNKLIWLVKNPSEFKQFEGKNIKFVQSENDLNKRTAAAYRYSLRAQYVFFTHAFKWVEQKTPGQIYVNLWHGCGFKASRRTEENKNIFDYCLVPGPVFVETKSVFFGEPKEKFLTMGYPRYDLYKSDNKNVTDYYDSIKKNKDTKNILWMPTFRQSKDFIYYSNPISNIIGLPTFSSVLQLEELDQKCREANVNLIIKKHRIGGMTDVHNKNLTNLIFLTNDDLDKIDVQLYEFIAKADALVTDYSSVAIDFLLLDKPVGFTLDDYEDYKNTRGFVFEDAREYMPGSHIYTFEELKQFVQDVADGKDEFRQKRHEVLKETHNKTESYSKRILDFFEIKA